MRLLFSAIIVLFLSYSTLAQTHENSNVHVTVDKMPKFKGGDEKFIDFIIQNTIYPLEAQEQKAEGEVVVQFIITKDGSITNIHVKEHVHPILDSAAMAVIKKMPPWQPGKKDGKKVAVLYSVPISFTLPK